jgi:hypothetical protein
MTSSRGVVHTLIAATLVVLFVAVVGPFSSSPARIAFDLPGTIECRDVTPDGFAASHPALKVIEGKFRISARIVAGDEGGIVDLLYMLVSPDLNTHFQDYLPNTTLESTVADDLIEITETTETAKAADVSAHVGYKALGGGVGLSKATKTSESSHYKQIAPKALVVASGTTGREHGVFFKIKPSKSASLEGAKEFTFLATVPKSWRGGWCTVSCAARATVRSWFSRDVVPGGVAQAQVGLFLLGDAEAYELADELHKVQQSHVTALDRHLDGHSGGLMKAMYSQALSEDFSASALCGIFMGAVAEGRKSPERTRLDDAQHAVSDAQQRLERLAE